MADSGWEGKSRKTIPGKIRRQILSLLSIRLQHLFCPESGLDTSQHVEEEDGADLPDRQPNQPRWLEQMPRSREQILSMGLPGIGEVP